MTTPNLRGYLVEKAQDLAPHNPIRNIWKVSQ
jgi:hypothetical protein